PRERICDPLRTAPRSIERTGPGSEGRPPPVSRWKESPSRRQGSGEERREPPAKRAQARVPSARGSRPASSRGLALPGFPEPESEPPQRCGPRRPRAHLNDAPQFSLRPYSASGSGRAQGRLLAGFPPNRRNGPQIPAKAPPWTEPPGEEL